MRTPSCVAFLFVAAAAIAQTPARPRALTAQSFLPDDYRTAIRADLAAVRKRGVWDELEASVLKVAFQRLAKESGIEIAALDRVTIAGVFREGEDGSETSQVMVLEGNVRLGMPPSVTQNWTEETIGELPARVRGREIYVSPKPELLVFGHQDQVRPVLEGKPHTGMPSPDVMSLLSGRESSLAYIVLDVAAAPLKERMLGTMFPDAAWAEGDAPTFLCVRVLATGSDDDPHLGLEAVVRHARAGAGLDVSEKAVDAFVARLVAMPQMRMVKPVLQRIEKKRDRTDLVCSVDLGRVRDAVGTVAALVAPLFLGVEQVEVRAAPVPAGGGAPKK